jgi:hypothetical protein
MITMYITKSQTFTHMIKQMKTVDSPVEVQFSLTLAGSSNT